MMQLTPEQKAAYDRLRAALTRLKDALEQWAANLFKALRNALRRLNCRHADKSFVCNIYGDMILQLNARSVWRCQSCGKELYLPQYVDEKEVKPHAT